ncbi:MAG: TonB-dependent receptor [Bacteroidales bacterium]
MRKFFLILVYSLSLLVCPLAAQEKDSVVVKDALKQNIRGRVLDQAAGFPLVGVTVKVESVNIEKYRITDLDGFFLFEDMPIGFYDITFSMVGYEKSTIERVKLSSGKEQVINHELRESVETLEGVTIQSFSRKDRPVNIRSNVSSRAFSLEETTKYAGSYGDPARMAANYAGVMPARDNRNDIIIRGNSSSGLIWKVDGMEIPNPNHFGATGSTGGPITMINTNLLARSDFLTGAFPAEYSNSVAGVFDLKLRNGNAFKREHWAQLGWNGLEFGTEGPINNVQNASYVMSYRYSFVDILSRLGVVIPETAQYQDFSFKVNVPSTKLGSFSLIGLRGDSKIELIDSEKEPERWMFETHSEDIVNTYRMGVLGLTHNAHISEESLFTTKFYVTSSDLVSSIDTFSIDNTTPYLWAYEQSEQMKFSLKSQFKHKVSSKTDISIGIFGDQYNVSFVDSQYVDNQYVNNVIAKNDFLRLYRAYADVLYRITSNVNTYLGVNVQSLENTGETVIEPRFSLSWDVFPNHVISFGSGLHSQMQPLMFYYVVSNGNDYTYNNQNLKFTRSYHNVLGYDYSITKDLRIKLEAYYQYLFNVPVSTVDSAYSLINYGAEYYIERKGNLVNAGKGENYGVEVTLEKFWSNNYFFLLSGSLFESKYKGLDNIVRNTAFNGNYAFNLLVGYEIHAAKRNRALNFGINLTYAGGRPYVPYDIDASLDNYKVMYDWDNAYNVNRDDYRRISFRIGMRRNQKKHSIETAFDFQYRTNYTNVYLDRLDLETGEVVKTYKMGFYPMGTIRVNF